MIRRYVIWQYETPTQCWVMDAAANPVYGPHAVAKCRAWCVAHGCVNPPVEHREGSTPPLTF